MNTISQSYFLSDCMKRIPMAKNQLLCVELWMSLKASDFLGKCNGAVATNVNELRFRIKSS
ncbi:hypothetical protein BC2230_10415 [Burkholderia cepacia]